MKKKGYEQRGEGEERVWDTVVDVMKKLAIKIIGRKA